MENKCQYTVEYSNETALIYETTEGDRIFIRSFSLPDEKEEYRKWVLSVPCENVVYTVRKDYPADEDGESWKKLLNK